MFPYFLLANFQWEVISLQEERTKIRVKWLLFLTPLVTCSISLCHSSPSLLTSSRKGFSIVFHILNTNNENKWSQLNKNIKTLSPVFQSLPCGGFVSEWRIWFPQMWGAAQIWGILNSRSRVAKEDSKSWSWHAVSVGCPCETGQELVDLSEDGDISPHAHSQVPISKLWMFNYPKLVTG